MSRWRKRPVVIDAWQFGSTAEAEKLPDWIDPRWFYRDVDGGQGKRIVEQRGAQYMLIPTTEGTLRAIPTDWIIRGVHGEVYPCKADVFAATYEPAD